jgi:hypothetical protein
MNDITTHRVSKIEIKEQTLGDDRKVLKIIVTHNAVEYVDHDDERGNDGRVFHPLETEISLFPMDELTNVEIVNSIVEVEASPCIHCGAPIDESGVGHEPGCFYETDAEKTYNADEFDSEQAAKNFASFEHMGETLTKVGDCPECGGSLFDNPGVGDICADCGYRA